MSNDLSKIDAYLDGCAATRKEMLHRIVRMNTAMQDLLESPKGIVPESAQEFYDSRSGKFK